MILVAQIILSLGLDSCTVLELMECCGRRKNAERCLHCGAQMTEDKGRRVTWQGVCVAFCSLWCQSHFWHQWCAAIRDANPEAAT